MTLLQTLLGSGVRADGGGDEEEGEGYMDCVLGFPPVVIGGGAKVVVGSGWVLIVAVVVSAGVSWFEVSVAETILLRPKAETIGFGSAWLARVGVSGVTCLACP